MEQIYHHYKEWEDWKQGMFSTNQEPDERVELAADLLKDPEQLLEAMRFVANEWKVSAEVNLSDTARNRQAWLGQASCCYRFGCAENTTKIAWRTLTADEQSIVNGIADKVIKEWEEGKGEKLLWEN